MTQNMYVLSYTLQVNTIHCTAMERCIPIVVLGFLLFVSRYVDDNSEVIPIDIVYTWVNGSDPKFLASLEYTIENLRHKGRNKNQDKSHFAENDQLRYSLRSVEKFAPWVRKIFIVTNGQVPVWLDKEHPKVKIVNHDTLFQNLTHLPSFNSNAIELHLHNIEGLSDYFIYLNDDFYFCRKLRSSDFYDVDHRTPVYIGNSIPLKTLTHLQMNSLNISTNLESGNLANIADKHAIYVLSLNFVRALFQRRYGITIGRQIAHTPYLLNRRIMRSLWQEFPRETQATSSHQLRTDADLQFTTFYFWYLMTKSQIITNESFTVKNCLHTHSGCTTIDLNRSLTKFKIQPTKEVLHVSLSNNLKDLNETLQRCRNELLKFACLNDEIDYTRTDASQVTNVLRKFHEAWLPQPALFELSHHTSRSDV